VSTGEGTSRLFVESLECHSEAGSERCFPRMALGYLSAKVNPGMPRVNKWDDKIARRAVLAAAYDPSSCVRPQQSFTWGTLSRMTDRGKVRSRREETPSRISSRGGPFIYLFSLRPLK